MSVFRWTVLDNSCAHKRLETFETYHQATRYADDNMYNFLIAEPREEANVKASVLWQYVKSVDVNSPIGTSYKWRPVERFSA